MFVFFCCSLDVRLSLKGLRLRHVEEGEVKSKRNIYLPTSPFKSGSDEGVSGEARASLVLGRALGPDGVDHVSGVVVLAAGKREDE